MNKDGGSAFPEIYTDHDRMMLGRSDTYSAGGMSLRDYFAATVTVTSEDYPNNNVQCVAIVGRQCPLIDQNPMEWIRWCADLEAIIRGIKADAMIAERDKSKLTP